MWINYALTFVRCGPEMEVIVERLARACIWLRLPEMEELRPKRDGGYEEGPIFREGNDDARAKEHAHKATKVIKARRSTTLGAVILIRSFLL